MSTKEMTRLEIMQKLKEKRMSQAEAARLMGIGERQVRRLWRIYRAKGAAGLVSKRRGQKSNHQLSQAVKQEALDQIKRQYSDFGPTLAHEKLTEKH